MTQDEQDRLWRNRFIIINLVRIGGTIVVLFGLVLSQTDKIVEGGALITGLVIAVAGLVASFAGPQWLARRWRTPPGP